VFVVVALVGGVTTTVVDVVHMVAVWDGDVAAPLAVRVVMPLMHDMFAGLALVEVAVVGFVQMAVVHIVDVIAMGDGDVPTPITVGVVVSNVLAVRGGHFGFLSQSQSVKEPIPQGLRHINACAYA
jgi:hypothetical protein